MLRIQDTSGAWCTGDFSSESLFLFPLWCLDYKLEVNLQHPGVNGWRCGSFGLWCDDSDILMIWMMVSLACHLISSQSGVLVVMDKYQNQCHYLAPLDARWKLGLGSCGGVGQRCSCECYGWLYYASVTGGIFRSALVVEVIFSEVVTTHAY